MKNVREIRRENLIRLSRGYKSQRRFAIDVGLVPSHMSQLLSGTRDMGEEVARRIEESLRLNPGTISLDPDHSPSTPPHTVALLDDELKLLSDYRRSSPRHREMLRETAAAYVKVDHG